MPRAKLKVVRPKKFKRDPDSEFIRTLVWVLDSARAGEVNAYAMIYIVKKDDGGEDIIESADVWDSDDRLIGLGAIRRLEHAFVKREWPEDAG